MMDYRTQIAVIIGKPLTFRHYPYSYDSVHHALDVGFRIYVILETYAERNKHLPKSTCLTLR